MGPSTFHFYNRVVRGDLTTPVVINLRGFFRALFVRYTCGKMAAPLLTSCGGGRRLAFALVLALLGLDVAGHGADLGVCVAAARRRSGRPPACTGRPSAPRWCHAVAPRPPRPLFILTVRRPRARQHSPHGRCGARRRPTAADPRTASQRTTSVRHFWMPHAARPTAVISEKSSFARCIFPKKI